ncbi:MAG TPA: succinate dehydrogenase/fumarate reductase iron-sulfur subunit [Bryobacteraceae bacterium]|nr:succinate dehydrogenase/fumarate reductase iron-sulfur subunit [Bryobacteraceae bacterium]
MLTYRVRVARSAAGGIGTGVQEFEIALEERMTVLDALFRIQREHDASLSFRCACRVGMCGTCTMSINGVPRLACRTRALTLQSPVIRIEPLPNLPVIKDLVVSLEPFFEQWKRIQPALHSKNPNATELARVPADSRYARETPSKRDCITCGACYAACGIKTSSEEYLGPAAINKAYLRLMDPRDYASAERLAILNEERGGIWRCHTQFNCTQVCPKGIPLTGTIATLKRAMLFPGRFDKA